MKNAAPFTRIKSATKIVALSVMLFVSACGQKNPYLGLWESEPLIGGLTEKIEFKSSSIEGNGKEVSA